MDSQHDPARVTCEIAEQRIADVSVLSVSGTVDMLTAAQLEQAITTAAGGAPAAVVVDLSAVEFLASAGMGVLAAAHAELTPAVKLAVVADGPATSRPLKLVGIADVVGLYATLDKALDALRS